MCFNYTNDCYTCTFQQVKFLKHNRYMTHKLNHSVCPQHVITTLTLTMLIFYSTVSSDDDFVVPARKKKRVASGDQTGTDERSSRRPIPQLSIPSKTYM